MSKIDLEPLVCLKRTRMDVEKGNCEYNVTDYLDTIEAALIELKEIKEAKTSVALENVNELEEIIDKHELDFNGIFYFDLDIIRDYILKTQNLEKENAYIEKIKTMLKQKDCALRYVESEDCFAVKTLLSDGWYKLTPEFVNNNVKEEIKPLPLIQKNVQLREENAKYKTTLENLEYENKMLIKESVRNAKIAERQHNAFNIIKEKRVNIEYLMKSKTVEEYNSYLYFENPKNTKFYNLTQEQFVLLKEVFA